MSLRHKVGKDFAWVFFFCLEKRSKVFVVLFFSLGETSFWNVA